MTTLSEILTDWSMGAPSQLDEALEISVVLEEASALQALRAAIEAAGGVVESRGAFQGALAVETGDRFQILRFPELAVVGAEAEAFALARVIADLPGVGSARPVLVDSLVGEAMVARDEGLESVFGGCNSDDAGPEARGWAPRGLGVLQAWKTTRGAGVTIASIDTGSSTHAQLAGVWSGKQPLNLVEHDADPDDRFSTDVRLANPGHGTLVASVIASRGALKPDGTTDDLKSVVGSAPEASVLPIRAIRSVVDIRQSRIPAAIEHAIAQDCDVIIMALGSPFAIEPVEVALRAAVRAGIVVICAAGNCVGFVVFPARFAPQGLSCAVAAVDYAYAPWEKTSKGDSVTVSAFGEAVWGARKREAGGADDEIAPSQGTTLASSLTAGCAALWVAAHGGRIKLKKHADATGVTVQKLFNDAVTATAWRPGGWPRGMGAGLVNAGALVARPLPGAEESLVDIPLPIDHVTPLKRYLSPVVGEADGLAGLEAAGLPESLAAEALWRTTLANARRRVDASGARPGLEGRETPVRAGSPALEKALGGKPHLSALVR